MSCYVYQLRLFGSERPFYIGKGRGRRMRDHFKPSELNKRSHKNRTILKAMRDGVEVLCEILFDGLTESEAHAKEVELIAFYGRRVNGGCLTNATDGGEGVSGYVPSDETREKLSKAQTGKKHSAEVRKKMSENRKGIRKSPVHKRAISMAHVGLSKSRDHVKNSRFSKWDNNPAWQKAEEMYLVWVSAGKPSRRKFHAMVGGKIDKLWSAFNSGWIPLEDEIWKEYRGC